MTPVVRHPLMAALLALAAIASAPTRGAAQIGEEACCLAPENGRGTATLPPITGQAGCSYNGTMEIVDGLGGGATIQIVATYGFFNTVTELPGGGLGGTFSNFQATLNLSMTGTGTLLGFARFISIPLTNAPSQWIDWGPRIGFAPVQTVAADLRRLQGQVLSDPDFDLLRITGGGDFGMTSPGQAQLVTSAGNWTVSSYIDIHHRIDFVGSNTGSLVGRSGSTMCIRRFTMCPGNVVPVEAKTWGGIKALLFN